jgi:bifunctional non-homologous end joining protein LigD
MARPSSASSSPATGPLRGLKPMKATTGEVPGGDDWAFEVKWDGMRVLAASGPDQPITAISGNGIEVSGRFPELGEIADAAGGCSVVLDGEVVVLDERGRSNFSLMQSRMHVERPERVAGLLASAPVVYVVFDLLVLDGNPVTGLPYTERRELLVDLVEPQPHLMVPAHQVGHGHELYAAAQANGLEGIMAKRLTSTYEPGRRSSQWRKCKVRRQQEVVIGGWAAGEGARSSSLGSLLIGVHDPDAPDRPLRYVGRVGTGFTDDTLRMLGERLEPLAVADPPFDPRPPRVDAREVHWVRPELVAEVEFGEWTPDARMRHPSYMGLRIDKEPRDVIREPSPTD